MAGVLIEHESYKNSIYLCTAHTWNESHLTATGMSIECRDEVAFEWDEAKGKKSLSN